MTTTDHTLGHFEHVDLKSSLRLRLSTHFGVTLSSSNTLSISQSQSASNSAVFLNPQSWVSKGQRISLSICLHIQDALIRHQEVERCCNNIANILAQAELWSQLGFDCRVDSVEIPSPLQGKTFDIRLSLNSHHSLHGDTDHAHRPKSIPDAPVPHGVPTIRLKRITVNLGLSAWPSHSRAIASHEPLRDPSNPSPTSGHCRAHGESLPGLVVVNLLDASLRRLLFGHAVSKVLDVVEAKRAETSSLFQLAPSIFCPGFREAIALRASTASNIACSLSRMSRRARSEELREARVRKMQDIDRLHHLRPVEQVQDHPASMQSITEVRLWYLMQGCLLDPRAHESIKPLQLPDNLQELYPLEDEMLEDKEWEITNWPGSTESQRGGKGYVSSEETMEVMMDDAADDLVPSFDWLNDEPSGEMMLDDVGCLDDEPSSETMLDDGLLESRASSPRGSFEDLMAMPVASWRTKSSFNDTAADSYGDPCATLLDEEGLDSHALTSRAVSEAPFSSFSMLDSEEMLNSSFSTVEKEAFAFSDAFENEEQSFPGGLRLEDKGNILDP